MDKDKTKVPFLDTARRSASFPCFFTKELTMSCFMMFLMLPLSGFDAIPSVPSGLQLQPEWKFKETRCNLASSLSMLSRDSKIVLERDREGYFLVSIDIPNGSTSIKLHLHAWTQIIVNNGILYYPEYGVASSGCIVHALDLMTGIELWKTELDGLNVKVHFKYSNKVNIEFVSDQIYVYGEESQGKYIEVLDAKTGKQIAHYLVK